MVAFSFLLFIIHQRSDFIFHYSFENPFFLMNSE